VPSSLVPASPASATSVAKPVGAIAHAISAPVGAPSHGLQSVSPSAGAGIADRGRIDGTHLIRPAPALAVLGGPARTVAGINGTTMRPKH
jgi:hypothetical protein